MKNLNRKLKIFSVLTALILMLSVGAFAEPEDDPPLTPEPGEEIVVTQPITEPVTQPPVVTEPVEADPNEDTTKPTEAPSTTTTTTVTSTTLREKSSNADLRTLEIKGVTSESEIVELTLSPEFNSEVKSYFIETDDDIISLKISATAVSSAAEVEIPKDLTLSESENIFKIVVTAEDDTTKTYEISVKLVEEEPTTQAPTETTTQPSTVVNVKPDYTKNGLNTYTKLGIVFAVGGASLLGISIYLFFKKKK